MSNDPAPGPIRDPRRQSVNAVIRAGCNPSGGDILAAGRLAIPELGRNPFDYTEYGFSIVPEQGDLIYLRCRGLRTKRVAEFATSIGMSTLYFAAAVRSDNDNGGRHRDRVGACPRESRGGAS